MRHSLGVDLGTTTIAAAIGDDLGTRAAHLTARLVEPSVVFCAADGTILTGEAALLAGEEEPSRLVRGFKRRVGDPTPIIVGGVGFAPEALMAAQLRDVVARITAEQGEPPARVVLTSSASWGPYRLEQFSQIGALSGVAVDEIISEPIATATYVARERGLDEGAIVAVFDLGGRTFDATVVRRGADGLEVLGSPEGVEHLGGDDFDDAVRGLLDQRTGGRISALDAARPADTAILAAVGEACTRAKEALSVREETVVRLPFDDADIVLTRPEFERAIRPAVGLAIAALLRTIHSAGIEVETVSTVILAGGSSRIPLVGEEVAALGRPVTAIHHPKFTVALGAAERARALDAPDAALASSPGLAAVGGPAAGGATASGSSSSGSSSPDADRRSGWGLSLRRGPAIVVGVAVAVVVVAAIVVAAVLGRAGGIEAATNRSDTGSGGVASASPPPPATASPAPAGAGKAGETATVASPVFTNGSLTAGLRWLVQSKDAAGVWEATGLADGAASRPNITLTRSDEGVRARWTAGADAQIYAQTEGARIDLTGIAADDGALVFDVTRNSGTAERLQIAADCGYPCRGSVDMTSVVNAFPQDSEQHVVIPARCFTGTGLNAGAVDTPFLALSTGDLELTFDDIRWENLVGDDPSAIRCGT